MLVIRMRFLLALLGLAVFCGARSEAGQVVSTVIDATSGPCTPPLVRGCELHTCCTQEEADAHRRAMNDKYLEILSDIASRLTRPDINIS